MKGYEIDSLSEIIASKIDGFENEEQNKVPPQVKNNFNIFSVIELFSKEGFLSKADRKELNKFKRDLDLEARLLDDSLSYDDLTPEQSNKVLEYFALITKITPKLEKASPEKINNLVKKYKDNNGKSKPFKKTRFRDLKKNIKNKDEIPIASLNYFDPEEEVVHGASIVI